MRASRIIHFLAAGAVALIFGMGPAQAETLEGGIGADLLRRASDIGFAAPDAPARVEDFEQSLQGFYESRDWQPIWLGNSGTDRALSALAVLEDAAREGLDVEDYELSIDRTRLGSFLRDASNEALAALEAELSSAILLYAHDVSVGRQKLRRTDSNVFAKDKTFNAAEVLRDLSDETVDPVTYLRGLAPENSEYQRLRHVLSVYRHLREQREEPPPVASGPLLKLGMRDERVAAVRERLKFFGDISLPSDDPEVYSPDLRLAVESFQRRHGLADDGVVGKQTLSALNVSLTDRIEQIRLNMERWRWLPSDLGDRYVLVNIAGFEVTMVDEGIVADRMRVVVGKTYRMTPVFSDSISYVEINPFWNVPPKIAGKDLLPKIQDDPAFLAEGGYEVLSGWDAGAVRLQPSEIDWEAVNPNKFPYKLRQAPGPKNALGAVKVMFPNRFDIYLHDSPARNLFEERVRAYSSGCIRLSRPFDLVSWLMRQTGGVDREKIEEIRATGETTIVKLPETIPVHLSYATAWAGEDGQVHFRDDLYGRDALLREALSEN